ncbi:aspartate/glutamate racemase family protein [Tropicimonas aquimaris]|uniref:Aspartate/glutamate racemase family protein n=1 Tax=Tropicimonas aquimaris TaxID=914152 RepID=A0ABW3ITG1_9RHOB
MAITLMNPNSNRATTEAMCAIAARALPEPPVGWTAPHGPSMITSQAALDAAAARVGAAVLTPEPTGIIVSAFGDPGAEEIARRYPCPVVGIGAAAARAAARSGTPFAVATTTPELQPAIDRLMQRNAASGLYAGCFLSRGDALALMADPEALDAALLEAVGLAVVSGARRVIIGGGPLGQAAERLRERAPVPLENPVLCAAREIAATLEKQHERRG